jgi:hypothetical protein
MVELITSLLVSKIRLRQLLLSNPIPTLDITALLISMKLVSQPTSGGIEPVVPGGPLYDKAKRCLFSAEVEGFLSMRMLQATILLAVYEISQAIYPAAFLSVGRCARLAFAMGIHDRKNVPQMFLVPGLSISLHTSGSNYLSRFLD